ncbi:hypothetical protein ASF98_22615 [Arthrobacter sp. Leaf337]|uniref:hypothetical protein n=1 Tax=Arthrobacter sp. Leaf337 TaxID=1736342 RepID=UPI0006FBE436|nr:hypothetical protein [Arthrobacter sp. Leaf337]KQR73202.1 hypothetical protein ASF98_22615 [Arthrobacter sp. Leaf337]
MEKQSTKSLWIALGVLVLLVVGSSIFFGFLLDDVEEKELQTGLTNIATLGGVTAGLSLAGAAILSLTGRAVSDLVDMYGPWIRGIIFGGYLVTIVASFVAGIGAMFPKWAGAPWLASASASVIFAGLLITALFINSAFRWHHSNPTPR